MPESSTLATSNNSTNCFYPPDAHPVQVEDFTAAVQQVSDQLTSLQNAAQLADTLLLFLTVSVFCLLGVVLVQGICERLFHHG